MSALTRGERDGLVARIASAYLRSCPPGPGDRPGSYEERDVIDEVHQRLLEEYGRRLPRVVMGASPFTGAPLERVWDPWGFDGPWWHMGRTWPVPHPPAPEDFRIELGAVALHGRVPVEATARTIAGPDVPYVVPRLLGMPGMVAVIVRLELATGDHAYPITYWSRERIPRIALHQPWLESTLWGEGGWRVASDPFDVDLGPWIARGQVRWIEPGDASHAVHGNGNGRACPFLDLPGERRCQHFVAGAREAFALPDGSPSGNPFADG